MLLIKRSSDATFDRAGTVGREYGQGRLTEWNNDMSGDHRLERLRELVGRLEQLPGSDERDRVIREVRARAVDLDTGEAPRAMLTVDSTGARARTSARPVPPPEPVEVPLQAPRKNYPPPPAQQWSRPVLRVPAQTTDSIDLLTAGEQLCLEELPVLHAGTQDAPGRRPWARGLRG
jgi:hypothetical protein